MKIITAFAFLFFALLSCQQDNSDNPTPTTCTEPSASFKYKFDGTLLEMNGSLSKNSVEGSYIRRVKDFFTGSPTQCGPYYTPDCTSYIYTIEATKWSLLDDEGNPILKIYIRSSTLTQGQSYSGIGNVKAVCFYPYSNTLSNPASSTNFTVTITKIENGYADGTFSGILTRGGATSYPVTEGEFHNVKILQ